MTTTSGHAFQAAGPGPIQVQVQVQKIPDLDLRSGSGVLKKRSDRTWTGPWTVYALNIKNM